MKIAHYINSFFYAITIIPYLTIIYMFWGMYAQFALGIIQLLIALILLANQKKLNKINRKHLLKYWTFALTNLFIIFILFKTNSVGKDIIQIVFVFISPMLIASYFVYITYLIQKQ